MSTAIRNFDLYRKVPKDLTESTISGALISVATVIFGLSLFMSELGVFVRVQLKNEMFIADSSPNEKMQINLNVTIHQLPCAVLSLDAMDVMGSHEVEIHGNMFKDRLTPEGKMISREEMKGSHLGAFSSFQRFSFEYDRQEADKVKEMIAAKEGCRVGGFLKVNRVPGNVHISTHSYSHMLGSLFPDWRNLDITHTVNHLSFGNDTDIQRVRNRFRGAGIVAPLDGVKQVPPTPEEKQANKKSSWLADTVIYEYYTRVVPTMYVSLTEESIEVHQFTANMNRIMNPQMPSIYFRYDISPVTVKFYEAKESFMHFMVQVCAIIGGIFTVAGLVDAVVHQSIKHVTKKAQLGKLT